MGEHCSPVVILRLPVLEPALVCVYCGVPPLEAVFPFLEIYPQKIIYKG